MFVIYLENTTKLYLMDRITIKMTNSYTFGNNRVADVSPSANKSDANLQYI